MGKKVKKKTTQRGACWRDAVALSNSHTVNAAEIGLVMSVYLAQAAHRVLITTAWIQLLYKYKGGHFL